LDVNQRSAASHRKNKQTLQLVVPGGRAQLRDATLMDTILREFWEETGRIVDRDALAQCLGHRSEPFDFLVSKYRLLIATHCVHETLPQAFTKKVKHQGYPSECLQQLYWLPWRMVRDIASANGVFSLHHDSLEPRDSKVPLSGFAASLLVRDLRVRRFLDQLAHYEPTATVSNLNAFQRNVDAVDPNAGSPSWYALHHWLPWSDRRDISTVPTKQNETMLPMRTVSN